MIFTLAIFIAVFATLAVLGAVLTFISHDTDSKASDFGIVIARACTFLAITTSFILVVVVVMGELGYTPWEVK